MKNKIIIFLSVIIVLIVTGLIIENYLIIKNRKKQSNEIDKKIIEIDKRINTREEKIKEAENLPDNEKSKKQQTIIKEGTETINELRDTTIKLNEEIKNIFYIDFGLSLILTAGFNQLLDFNFTVGLMYRKYFLSGRLHLGTGITLGMSRNFNSNNFVFDGVNIIFEIGINFRKKER